MALAGHDITVAVWRRCFVIALCLLVVGFALFVWSGSAGRLVADPEGLGFVLSLLSVCD